MSKTSTTIWDPATHLRTTDDVAAYLEAALQDGDPQLVAAALGDIARAKGMSQVARDAGLGRESLYKSLSSSGNPELATVLKVISALGLEMHVTAVTARRWLPNPAPGVNRPPQTLCFAALCSMPATPGQC
jgi:probable addiction module antidote protein